MRASTKLSLQVRWVCPLCRLPRPATHDSQRRPRTSNSSPPFEQKRYASSSNPRRSPSSSQFYRSDFANQPFTGTYEPGLEINGPLGAVSKHGAPRLTPKALKKHLDDYVVGQERAKKILSVAVFNHYQRVQELQRREEEEAGLLAQRQRRESHPVESRQ